MSRSKIKENIILQDIIIDRETVRYKFSVSAGLRPYFTTDEMYVRYDRDVSCVPPSIMAIPFVSSVIALTWLTDSILWVNEIDETFYNSIKELKRAYQELYSYYPLGGRFVAAYRRSNAVEDSASSQALLLFSGGIDAHTSYIRNINKQLLLCNIQGWLHTPDADSEAQKADFRDVEHFAEMHSNECSLIKSNFALLVDARYFAKHITPRLHDSWWHGFQHSMAFIAIAIPIAYIKGICEILIASSHSIGGKGVCASYPTTDTEFRFAKNGYTTHDGFELTRQDKVRLLVEHQKKTGKAYPIRVCSFNDHNCCVCPKCFRSIMGIIAEGGEIEKFGFNIDGNKKSFFENYIRHHYIEFGIDREAALFWPEIRQRMRQNYEQITEKELVDWFCSTDFVKQRKEAVLKYRITNFFPLLIKKFKS